MTEERDSSILRTMLQNGKPIAVVPKGESMRPIIAEGRTVVGVAPLKGEPKVGDIIAFSRSGDNANIIHRLVAVEGKVYITRGDNCLGCEYSGREQLFGVVEWIRRGEKTIRVTDKKYLRYVSYRNRTWPIRRRIFRLRAVYRRLKGKIARVKSAGKTEKG